MLSCSCSLGDYEWYYYPSDDFIEFNESRRKRCCSCKELINNGDDCLRFNRSRDPKSDIEERIWGDQVSLADWYMCFGCGGVYLSLDAIGYKCLDIEDIQADLEDYWDLTGFEPK